METLETLRSRVETAEDLHSVVRTMKALAAVTIRQYREAVTSVRTYSQTLEMGCQVLLQAYPDQLIDWPGSPEGRVGVIAFGSDQGMCGPFNERMSDFVLEARQRYPSHEGGIPTISIGQRLAARLDMLGVPIEYVHRVPGSTSEIAVSVDRLLVEVERWRQEAGVEYLLIYYHRLLSGANYEPRERQVLPIDPDWLESLRHKPWSSRRLPTHASERDDLLAMLVRQYVFIELFRAFAESLASENASRLASMQVAERSIEERIDDLNAQYHQQRQQAITQELLDIVSGYIATSE